MNQEECSFCGKHRREVHCQIAAKERGVLICNECVALAVGIILSNLHRPTSLHAATDESAEDRTP